MTDKTKSQTYNFLLENKSIEDIKTQENIEVKEIKNKRHGGKTFRIDNAKHQQIINDPSENNTENLEAIVISLIDNQNMQETTNEIWKKIINYLNWTTSNAEEIIQAQTKIKELENKIQQLKKENKELENKIQQLKKEIKELKQSKHDNIKFDKFKYNAITIYDEKQRKKTGINKIHEEILPIEDKIIFITTFVHIDNSITEEIIYFQQLTNGNFEVIKQLKKYENINEYKNDLLLIEENSNHEKNIKVDPIPIKDFLKKQQNFKLKPTKIEISIWSASWLIPITIISIGLIHPPLLVTAILLSIASLALKETTVLFLPVSIKVKSWIRQKFYSLIHKIPFVNKRNLIKTKEQQETEKNINKSIENLTNDKLETKLETQYDILKQELDNKKDKNWYELINNETINKNSNSILENSSVEPLNPNNFDSSIRNTVNQKEQQQVTSSNHNWNKVKCLLT